jgi:hypothetical protein
VKHGADLLFAHVYRHNTVCKRKQFASGSSIDLCWGDATAVGLLRKRVCTLCAVVHHLGCVQGMKHADFIVEAVVEDEGVKKGIFQQLDKVRAGI